MWSEKVILQMYAEVEGQCHLFYHDHHKEKNSQCPELLT